MLKSSKQKLEQVKKWQQENREYYRESQKRWRQEHPNYMREYRMRHRERHLQRIHEYNAKPKNKPKLRARGRVKYRSKYPIGKECSICKATKHLECHHPDYSKPSEYVTLCKTCHRKTHGVKI